MNRSSRLAALLGAFAFCSSPLAAQSGQETSPLFADAEAGTRFGLHVTDEAGREIVSIAADDRFVPASNTKLYTTALAFETLSVEGPDERGGASVSLRPAAGAPDVILSGFGDARLSSAADCEVDCLAELADSVAATVRTVGDVVGDDSYFPDERWPGGMSWNNMVTRYGTAISALTVDDNEWTFTLSPAPVGERAEASGDGYYTLRSAVTVGNSTDLMTMRQPGTDILRVAGTVAQDALPYRMRLGVEDPARRAAWLLRNMLEDRGVTVTGSVTVRHRPLTPADEAGAEPVRPPRGPALAKLTPPPLSEDILRVNKESQNLHAELLLRRAGAAGGSGSVASGLLKEEAMLDRAGVERWRYDFADGSGMSNYNRVTPSGTVAFLRWTQTRPWGAAWRETLPVAGVDGTLARRFDGTPLEGKLFAKTGSLNGASALSGFLIAASGRTLIFSVLANDMPAGVSATDDMDAALLRVAAAN